MPAKGIMAEDTFDLDRAERLLPQLERWLKAAIDSRKRVAELEAQEARQVQRVSMSGGQLLDIGSLIRRREEKDQWIASLRAAADEIESAGCLLKDLNIGLIDFPCELDGREVYLCWKLGEPAIRFWHNTDEGYAGRKPIDAAMMERLRSQSQ